MADTLRAWDRQPIQPRQKGFYRYMRRQRQPSHGSKLSIQWRHGKQSEWAGMASRTSCGHCAAARAMAHGRPRPHLRPHPRQKRSGQPRRLPRLDPRRPARAARLRRLSAARSISRFWISSLVGITRSAPFLVVITEAAAFANVSISFRFSSFKSSIPCSQI